MFSSQMTLWVEKKVVHWNDLQAIIFMLWRMANMIVDTKKYIYSYRQKNSIFTCCCKKNATHYKCVKEISTDMSRLYASTQKPESVFAHLPESADVMAMSGGMRSASVVGRAIGSISLLFQSCCSACRKASGGSCRFRLDRLRTWMSSMPGAAPSSASAPGFSGDPSHTWHNTNTNLPFTSARSFTELCGTDLGRWCWVHRPTDVSCLSFIFLFIQMTKGQETAHTVPRSSSCQSAKSKRENKIRQATCNASVCPMCHFLTEMSQNVSKCALT